MKYRKKPVEVEAIQWDGGNVAEMEFFLGVRNLTNYNPSAHCFTINTLEGNHLVEKYSWVIKGVKGEYYPCKSDIFEMTYEKV